jgi:hypothetical protein
LILLGLLLLGYRSFGSEEKDRSHPHSVDWTARPPGSRGPGVKRNPTHGFRVDSCQGRSLVP